jgi:hypothetical protein
MFNFAPSKIAGRMQLPPHTRRRNMIRVCKIFSSMKSAPTVYLKVSLCDLINFQGFYRDFFVAQVKIPVQRRKEMCWASRDYRNWKKTVSRWSPIPDNQTTNGHALHYQKESLLTLWKNDLK